MEGYTAQPESWRWFSIGTIKMAWCLTNKHLHVYKILSPPCKLTKSSTGDFFIVAVRIQLNLDNTFKNDIPVSCKTQQISCTFRNLTPQMKGPNLEVALKGDKEWAGVLRAVETSISGSTSSVRNRHFKILCFKSTPKLNRATHNNFLYAVWTYYELSFQLKLH